MTDVTPFATLSRAFFIFVCVSIVPTQRATAAELTLWSYTQNYIYWSDAGAHLDGEILEEQNFGGVPYLDVSISMDFSTGPLVSHVGGTSIFTGGTASGTMWWFDPDDATNFYTSDYWVEIVDLTIEYDPDCVNGPSWCVAYSWLRLGDGLFDPGAALLLGDERQIGGGVWEMVSDYTFFDGVEYRADKNGSTLSLSTGPVVPEPSSLVLLAVGLGFVARRRGGG